MKSFENRITVVDPVPATLHMHELVHIVVKSVGIGLKF